MIYRKEIDGLRAVAVLPVILFHAGVETFSGGFVGVDIFFVISGYLITSIILHELEKDRFSIVKFYERRARRILPALISIVVLCIPFAITWIPTDKFDEFSKSVVAVPLFSSNILFWRESGYFALDTDEMPLIHTWSLAVEEQYYVFFPLLMIFFWKFEKKKSLMAMIIIIGLISFLIADWGSRTHPSANFYLIPSRAWELFIGSLTAFYLNGGLLNNRVINNFPAMAGALLIAYSIFAYNQSTPFPGSYALAPTIGTALIILFATQNTIVNIFVSLN